MPDAALIAKLRQTMAAIFEMEEASIPEDASPENISKWDSLHHMNLIVALEGAFDIQFADEEVMARPSLASLAAAIDRHLASR